MVIYAPAKINLYLKITGKRSDGYHALETIFEKIALCDRITLRSLPCTAKKNETRIFSDDPAIPTNKKSLIYRTVELFRKKSGISNAVEVGIFKRIPVAAGLGGGSSDAANILAGLNRLWKMPLSAEDLVKIARTLGSDIPFFLCEKPYAVATGRGDEVLPLNWKLRMWHLIIYLPIKLLSKEIYALYGKSVSLNLTKRPDINKILSLDASCRTVKDLIRRCSGQSKRIEKLLYNSSITPDFSQITRCLRNDLESVVLKKEPVVARLKKALKDTGSVNSMVSGSGPSVVSLFLKRKEAQRAKELLEKRYPVFKQHRWRTFVVQTL